MRIITPINDNWLFLHRECEVLPALPDPADPDASIVSLPHSWNAVDGHDGHLADVKVPGRDWAKGDLSGEVIEPYDRGAYWYFRTFTAPTQPLPGGRTYIEVLAAGQQAELYVNGVLLTTHKGGYSAFRADATGVLRESDNLLAIHVSNRHRSDVYPQHADFTFYGGLYRGVNIISVPAAHFDLDYFGGPGVMVTPRVAEGAVISHRTGVDGVVESTADAEFEINSFISGLPNDKFERISVNYSLISLYDEEEVWNVSRPVEAPAVTVPLPDAHLWSPETPYLYRFTASLIWNNETLDEVFFDLGVRTFSCTASEGFTLNGLPTPLRGVSRHQDRLYKGNALTEDDHWADALLIKELGANSIRLAHYQHSQVFYEACDELGFVVWAEIPFITIMNEDPAAHDNCVSQMTELIVQNYHHPSICFWGLSNEVLLAGKINDTLVENHKALNTLVKSLDSTRLTTMAHVAFTPLDSPLHRISDTEGYNNYFGWYYGTIEDNAPWMDDFHEKNPDIPLALSEYGCEGLINVHTDTPAAKDYSEEYQALYHEYMARAFAERPWIWGSYVWNMFDFGAAARNEGGVAGRNNKGLMTMDRLTKKDSYYVYQAWWTKVPMVHICGRRHALRKAQSTEIRVYSNQPEVTLRVNGEEQTLSADKVFIFHADLKAGMNTLIARAGDAKDVVVLEGK